MDHTVPPFLQEIVKTSRDIWSKGWAEANAGNISVRLVPHAADLEAMARREGTWVPLASPVPSLSGEMFLVTGSGRYLRNIELFPEKNVGVIELDRTGSAYRIIWGFQPSGGPTSELAAHLAAHSVRSRISEGIERAIIHTHSPHLIALTSVVEPDTQKLTRLLWSVHAECIVVFPDGVEVIGWEIPGTTALAERTALAFEHRRVALWQFHGVIASGRNLDSAFGLIDTVEKAASIYLMTIAAGGARQTLPAARLRELAAHFQVEPDPDILGGDP
jgi:rhamnulose-1-phosphate aldolase